MPYDLYDDPRLRRRRPGAQLAKAEAAANAAFGFRNAYDEDDGEDEENRGGLSESKYGTPPSRYGRSGELDQLTPGRPRNAQGDDGNLSVSDVKKAYDLYKEFKGGDSSGISSTVGPSYDIGVTGAGGLGAGPAIGDIGLGTGAGPATTDVGIMGSGGGAGPAIGDIGLGAGASGGGLAAGAEAPMFLGGAEGAGWAGSTFTPAASSGGAAAGGMGGLMGALGGLGGLAAFWMLAQNWAEKKHAEDTADDPQEIAAWEAANPNLPMVKYKTDPERMAYYDSIYGVN